MEDLEDRALRRHIPFDYIAAPAERKSVEGLQRWVASSLLPPNLPTNIGIAMGTLTLGGDTSGS